ncbi:VWA domain-containing protein [Devosia sp. BSSL-BM10]|uniref:VWA domain-containing protein n=1 Tax=Devosia litorisediminis TaxID=2829817 RepID=A0A942E668_9HYPH|nr:VWA domain-containing protein [Devosia litorisediminis]MBS3848968.1 VWA domain-containing protein [Devosia litorisediminis]
MAEKDRTKQGSVLRQEGKVSDSVAAFVRKVGAVARPNAGQDGRLLFALDATMSRQPTWDLACSLQAEMFKAIPKDSALQVQLLYFRGLGECRASKWVIDAGALSKLMSGIDCRGGNTQIGRVFAHARTEHTKRRINAVVFVGDAIEENVDALAAKAGQLGLLGCPLFVFQEGRDSRVEAAFREFARLSKGAYARFDASAPQELAALLKAVAAFASGGRDLLKLQNSGQAKALLAQIGHG